MPDIEVFADIVCPFTYVGLSRLFAVRDARHADARVRVRAWPLEWVNQRPLEALKVADEIAALRVDVAPDLFRGFDLLTFPRTSVPAFGLAAAAYDASPEIGEHVSVALRRALFEEGFDVSDPEVLRDIGAPYGVEPLDDAAARAVTTADWNAGRARGVVGSPHFFAEKGDWFCPTLRIARVEAHYDVHLDLRALEDFYDVALGRA